MRIRALALLLALTPLPAAAQRADPAQADAATKADAAPAPMVSPLPSSTLMPGMAFPGPQIEPDPSVPTYGDGPAIQPPVTDSTLDKPLKKSAN